MRLVLAIVQDEDAGALAREFIQNNAHAAKLTTSGGLLKTENMTFIVGIEDDRVNEVLEITKKSSRTGEQYASNMNMDATGTSMLGKPIQITVGKVTAFVLPVEESRHF